MPWWDEPQPWDQPLFCEHGNPVEACARCGIALGEQGQALAASSADALAWWRNAWAALLKLAAASEPFTSEHVIAMVGLPRRSAQGANSAVGSLIGHASKAGLIQLVGSTPATRPISHGAQIGLWEGVEQEW